jgi:hypothetical protein
MRPKGRENGVGAMPKGFWQFFVFAGFLMIAGQAAALAAEGGEPAGPQKRPAATEQASGQPDRDVAAPAKAAPAGQVAPAGKSGHKSGKSGHPVPGSPAVQAAEQRYQDYLDREKAASEAGLARQRGKIEDKYKGFVRTVKPRGKKTGGDEKTRQMIPRRDVAMMLHEHADGVVFPPRVVAGRVARAVAAGRAHHPTSPATAGTRSDNSAQTANPARARRSSFPAAPPACSRMAPACPSRLPGGALTPAT